MPVDDKKKKVSPPQSAKKPKIDSKIVDKVPEGKEWKMIVDPDDGKTYYEKTTEEAKGKLPSEYKRKDFPSNSTKTINKKVSTPPSELPPKRRYDVYPGIKKKNNVERVEVKAPMPPPKQEEAKQTTINGGVNTFEQTDPQKQWGSKWGIQTQTYPSATGNITGNDTRDAYLHDNKEIEWDMAHPEKNFDAQGKPIIKYTGRTRQDLAQQMGVTSIQNPVDSKNVGGGNLAIGSDILGQGAKATRTIGGGGEISQYNAGAIGIPNATANYATQLTQPKYDAQANAIPSTKPTGLQYGSGQQSGAITGKMAPIVPVVPMVDPNAKKNPQADANDVVKTKFKRGGLVDKIKGYAFGGEVDENGNPVTYGGNNVTNNGAFTPSGDKGNFYQNQSGNATVVGQNDEYSKPTKKKLTPEQEQARQNKNAQYAQAAGGAMMVAGNAMYQKPTDIYATKDDATSDVAKSSIDSTASQMTPWYGMAKGASNMGKGMLAKDKYGDVKGGGNKAAEEWMTPDHELIIDGAKQDGVAGAVREATGFGKISRSAANVLGKSNETTGFWGNVNQASGMTKKNEKLNKPFTQQLQEVNAANTKSAQQQALANREAGTTNLAGKNKPLYDVGTNPQYDKDKRLMFKDGSTYQGPQTLKGGGLVNSLKPVKSNDDIMNIAHTGKGYDSLNKYDKQRVDAMKKHMEEKGNKETMMMPKFVNNFSNGGQIKGKGTAKSDSIKAKVEEGSFIVPAENSEVAKDIRKVYLKVPKSKQANVNQKEGEEVKLSNGEHLFTPEENEYLESIGVNLEDLAPNAENEQEEDAKKNGGLTAQKAKMILHDGTIRGKKITEQQRKFFGAISNGESISMACGGKVKGYAEGGPVKGTKYNGATWDGKNWVSPNGSKYTEEGGKKFTEGYNNELAKNKKNEQTRLNSEINVYKRKLNEANQYGNKSEAGRLQAKINELSGIKEEVSAPSEVKQSTSTKPTVKVPSTKKTSAVKTPSFADESMASNVAQENAGVNNVFVPSSNVNKASEDKAIADAKKLNDSLPQTIPSATPPAKRGILDKIGNIDPTSFVGVGQTALGLNMLKGEKRPVWNPELNIAYNDNVERSIQDARFGLTPQQKFAADQDIQNAANDARFSARNFSGGNAGTAFNQERMAINDAWRNKLGLTQADQAERMRKQQYMDEQVANRANIIAANRRTAFNDAMGAFQQKQQSGSELIGAGLQNTIGAYRFNKEMQAKAAADKERNAM